MDPVGNMEDWVRNVNRELRSNRMAKGRRSSTAKPGVPYAYPCELTATTEDPTGADVTAQWASIGGMIWVHIEVVIQPGFTPGTGAYMLSLPFSVRPSVAYQILDAHVVSNGEWAGTAKLEGGGVVTRIYVDNDRLLSSSFGLAPGNTVIVQGWYSGLRHDVHTMAMLMQPQEDEQPEVEDPEE